MVFVDLVVLSILFTGYFQTCRLQVSTPLLYSSRLLPQLASHHGTVLIYNCLHRTQLTLASHHGTTLSYNHLYHLRTQLTLSILVNRTKSLLDILPLHPLLPSNHLLCSPPPLPPLPPLPPNQRLSLSQ